MATFLALFLLDWVFFTLLITGIIIITWIHETEDNLGWAHTIFIALTCLVAYKIDFSYEAIIAAPAIALKYVGVYIGIGILWAFIKWYFHLKRIANLYSEIKEQAQSNFTFKENSKTTLKDVIYELWSNEYRKKYRGLEISKNGGEYKVNIPMATDNKALIVSWISHWPISAAWTALNDPIKKFINYIFSHIKGMFQKMSNHIFKDTINDFK